jgi:IS30 family transposase
MDRNGEGGKRKHLTLQERIDIWSYLGRGWSFKEIGAELERDPTTISKEVRRHRYFKAAKKYGDIRDHPCKRRRSCTKRKLCTGRSCRIPCRECLECYKHCDEFTAVLCDISNRPPYVCNGCDKQTQKQCKDDKYYYNGNQAYKEYQVTLSEARQGADISRDALMCIEDLAEPLIKKGQPLNHIYAHHKEEIGISKRTFYRYVDKGYIGLMNIDMRRVVRYKQRKKNHTSRPDPAKKNGPTWDCFEEYVKGHPGIRVV